jgi:L-threonylcarbamoyladenylate synthase
MYNYKDLEIAAEYIRQGKLVAFPTETVYGLGANALNPLAVAKIYELKERPSFDPLIIHIADINNLQKYAVDIDNKVYKLGEKFWPGPLTIILKKNPIIPDIVTAGLNTVAIRIPDNEIALQLIKLSDCPIAAPSANKFGKVSPTTAQHVKKQLPQVDYIIDGGKTKIGIESTIIKLNEKGFEILRHGIILKEEIEKVIPYYPSEKNNDVILASGNFKSHYSPEKPLYILGEHNIPYPTSQCGLISFTKLNTNQYKKVIYVSENNDLKEYAVNLFSAIHELEDSDVNCIVAEPVPEIGVGIAIMDRLRKAAYRFSSY